MEPVDEPGEAQAEPPQPPSQDAPLAEEPTDAAEPVEEPEQAQAEAAPRDTSAQPTVPPPLPGAPPGASGVNHPNTWVLNRALDTYRDAMASFTVGAMGRGAGSAIARALDEPHKTEFRERMMNGDIPAEEALRIPYFPIVLRSSWTTRNFARHFDGDLKVLESMQRIAEARDGARWPGTADLPADEVQEVLELVSDLLERIGHPDLAGDVNRLGSQLREGPSAQDRLEREQAPAGPRAATPQPEPARGAAERGGATTEATAGSQRPPTPPDSPPAQPHSTLPSSETAPPAPPDKDGSPPRPAGSPQRFVRWAGDTVARLTVELIVLATVTTGGGVLWLTAAAHLIVGIFVALVLLVAAVAAYRLGWLRRGATVAPGVARSIRRALGIVLAAARAAGNRARRVASTAARAARDSAWLRGIISLAPRAARSLVRVLAMGVAAARGAGGPAAPAPVSAQIEETGTDSHAARAQTPPVQAETELLGRAGAPPVEVQIRQGSALPDYSYPNYDALSTGSKIYTDAMRRLIRDRLSGSSPADWWDTLVLRRLESGQRSSIEQKTREHHEKERIDLVDAPHFLNLVMKNYELFHDVFGTGSRNERLTRRRLSDAAEARNEGPGHSPTGDLNGDFVQLSLLAMKHLLERFDRPAADRIDALFGSLTREAAPEAAQPMRERGVHVPVRGPGLLSGALKRTGGSLVSIRLGVGLLAVALLLVVGAGAWFIVSPGGSEAPASPAERAAAAPSSPPAAASASPTAAAAPTPTPTVPPTVAATAPPTAAASPTATTAATAVVPAEPPKLWTIDGSNRSVPFGVAHRDNCDKSTRRSGLDLAKDTGDIWYDGTAVLHDPVSVEETPGNCEGDAKWTHVTGWAILKDPNLSEAPSLSEADSWIHADWLKMGDDSPAAYAEALSSAGCVPRSFSLVVLDGSDNAWLEVRCIRSDEWEAKAFESAVAVAVTGIGCSKSEPDDDKVVVWCDTGKRAVAERPRQAVDNLQGADEPETTVPMDEDRPIPTELKEPIRAVAKFASNLDMYRRLDCARAPRLQNPDPDGKKIAAEVEVTLMIVAYCTCAADTANVCADENNDSGLYYEVTYNGAVTYDEEPMDNEALMYTEEVTYKFWIFHPLLLGARNAAQPLAGEVEP